jgi:hypothetical protein
LPGALASARLLIAGAAAALAPATGEKPAFASIRPCLEVHRTGGKAAEGRFHAIGDAEGRKRLRPPSPVPSAIYTAVLSLIAGIFRM